MKPALSSSSPIPIGLASSSTGAFDSSGGAFNGSVGRSRPAGSPRYYKDSAEGPVTLTSSTGPPARPCRSISTRPGRAGRGRDLHRHHAMDHEAAADEQQTR
jgi:hypothetical protein